MATASPLADAVLPLIRSRSRDLWQYGASNEHGEGMHDGVDILEAALADPRADPRDVYAVTHRALSSAVRVIARADDSAGIIGGACRRLIDVHSRAAARAEVSQRKLADWMFDFHFDDEADYVQLDPVAYALALGDRGRARLHERVEKLRAEFAAAVAAGSGRSYDHRGHLLDWFDQRFAVLDRDVEAIIRTHLRDGRVAAWFEDVARAFEEIERNDLAIEWSERATMFDLTFQSQRAAERWWRLLGEHRPSELPRVARVVFERWPSAATGGRLVDVIGPDAIDDVRSELDSRPSDLVRFELDTVRDVRTAWDAAHRLMLADDRVWASLAKAYLPVDPVAAIRVQLRLVATSLEKADTSKYGKAARELVRIRTSALRADIEALALVDAAVFDLRERYARRPRLMDALDRARLP